MRYSEIKKVAVLCGGKSDEREISLRSGKNCFNAVKKLGFEAKLCDIQTADDLISIKNWGADLAFLTTHGKHGEDGSLQGALEWLEIPYTGSKKDSSALCMDKYLSKLVMMDNEIPCCSIKIYSPTLNYEDLVKEWGVQQFFIKPRRGGSSIFTYKIDSKEDFESFEVPELDDELVIEPLVKGREMTIGFIYSENGWLLLPILELKPKAEFYNFETKYTEGQTEFIIPAPLTGDQLEYIQKTIRKCIHVYDLKGYGRIDFFIDDMSLNIIEINTLPGMTDTSDVPAEAKVAGYDYVQCVEMLIKSECKD